MYSFELQYNSLAFVAGVKRATAEGSLPEIAQYSPYYLVLNVLTASNDQTFLFYFQTPVSVAVHTFICNE